MEIIRAGLVPYAEADRWQRELAARRGRGEIPDTLLLLEHPPVITQGRRDSRDGLRLSPAALRAKGIEFAETDRGGKLTYHGPGQLVGYFIFGLGSRTVPEFVRQVEELVIRLLLGYGIQGGRDPRYPGVWVSGTTRAEGKKIAALGLHFEKGVSRHGFALNIDCDLTPFSWFEPCGIRDREVTSMANELGRAPSPAEVKASLAAILPGLFDHSP